MQKLAITLVTYEGVFLSLKVFLGKMLAIELGTISLLVCCKILGCQWMMNCTLTRETVSSLMSTNENSWDIDLVMDMFDTRDIEIILSIPLSNEVHDSWY